MTQTGRKRWAGAYLTDKIVFLETCSGLARAAADPQGKLHILSFSAVSDEELGAALRDALVASRVLDQAELAVFFEPTALDERYETKVKRVLETGAHSNRRELFTNMKHCPVVATDEEIVIRPTVHEKLESWSGLGAEFHVRVSSRVSNADLGKVLRLAFARST